MADRPPRLDAPVCRHPIRFSWWLGAAGLSGLALVWWQSPGGQVFYPRCLLYVTTGWQCPGCGATRATHALLHGHLLEAWQFNAMWVLLSPLVLWTYLAWLVNETWNCQWFQPLGTRLGIALMLGSLAGFGLARNLPWMSWMSR